MNLLIHDFATAIEREATDGSRLVEELDPARLAVSERYSIGRRSWRIPRFAFEVDADDRRDRSR